MLKYNEDAESIAKEKGFEKIVNYLKKLTVCD